MGLNCSGTENEQANRFDRYLRILLVSIKWLYIENVGKGHLGWFHILAWLIAGQSRPWDKE